MKITWKIFLTALAVLLASGIATGACAEPGKFSVQADELDYDLRTGEGEAKGHVVIVEDSGKATGNYAKFNSKKKSGRLVGNVIADRDDAHIVCNEFIAHNENDLSAIGNAVLTKEGKSLSADRVDYFKQRKFAETVGSWARLTDVDGSVLNAAKIDYDMDKGLAHAYGGVDIKSEARDLTASADNAVYKTDQGGYVELIGNATATQNGNTVSGAKLRLNNANVAVADGDVKIHYIPEEKPAPAGELAEEQVLAEADPALVEKEAGASLEKAAA